MNTNKNETPVVIKPVYQRHVSIDENIHEALSIHSFSLYMVLRYQADFRKEDSEIKRSAQFLYTKAKIKKSQYYLSMKELEEHGLVLRDPDNKLGEKCVIHVARELGYFNRGVHTVDRGVHTVDTDQYSSSGSNINITTTSESDDSSSVATKSKKKNTQEMIKGMIQVYRKIFPNNPQPHPRLISTTLQKTLQTLIKRWPEVDPKGYPLDLETFELYLQDLRVNAPKFALGEYVTKDGNKKKNGMETFCRWNTLVNHLENKYS